MLTDTYEARHSEDRGRDAASRGKKKEEGRKRMKMMMTAMGTTGIDLPLCKALSLRYVTGCHSELIKTSASRPVSPPSSNPAEVGMSHINNADLGDFFGLQKINTVCTLALM